MSLDETIFIDILCIRVVFTSKSFIVCFKIYYKFSFGLFVELPRCLTTQNQCMFLSGFVRAYMTKQNMLRIEKGCESLLRQGGDEEQMERVEHELSQNELQRFQALTRHVATYKRA